MKRLIVVLILAGLLLALSVPAALALSGNDLSWWTVDGGGGGSSGGNYSLNGTIGQPDAGTLSGGSYTLTGGFWVGSSGSVAPGGHNVYLPLVRR